MRELCIIVCIKQVPDPEGPPSAFRIDSEAKRVIPSGIPPVINPPDENALEAALRLRESCGGRVVAISMGTKLAKPVLSKALAVGADDLILLDDERFRDLDSYSTAFVLTKAIRKIGAYDAVLTGTLAGDWGFGQTGTLLAEMLQIPLLNVVRKMKQEDGNIIAEKVEKSGYAVVRAPMPVLITVSSEVGDLRMALVKDMMAARKKPITVWSADDIGVDPQALRQRKVYSIVAPRSRECTFVGGQSSEERARNLITMLKNEGVI